MQDYAKIVSIVRLGYKTMDRSTCVNVPAMPCS